MGVIVELNNYSEISKPNIHYTEEKKLNNCNSSYYSASDRQQPQLCVSAQYCDTFVQEKEEKCVKDYLKSKMKGLKKLKKKMGFGKFDVSDWEDHLQILTCLPCFSCHMFHYYFHYPLPTYTIFHFLIFCIGLHIFSENNLTPLFT